MPRTNKDFSFRKEQLIKLALEQFVEKGYESTTITDLQKSFGLTKGGLYHYFNSKEDILDAVIEYGLAEGALELAAELESIPLEKRLIHVFFHSVTNDFTQRLFQYSKQSGASIVAYRLREKTMQFTIGILKDIVREYVETGFYQTQYPDEMIAFSVVLAMTITDEGMLPQTDFNRRKNHVDALLDLWSRCMRPPPEHMDELRMNLYGLIGFDDEEREN